MFHQGMPSEKIQLSSMWLSTAPQPKSRQIDTGHDFDSKVLLGSKRDDLDIHVGNTIEKELVNYSSPRNVTEIGAELIQTESCQIDSCHDFNNEVSFGSEANDLTIHADLVLIDAEIEVTEKDFVDVVDTIISGNKENVANGKEDFGPSENILHNESNALSHQHFSFRNSNENILLEGWLHKKGSGNDLFRSTDWKLRWARLTYTSITENDLYVPVLHFYWYQDSQIPCTSINLDSNIIIPMDNNDDEPYAHSFNIVTVKSIEPLKNQYVTNSAKVISAPLKERDEWIFTINMAIKDYERKKLKFLHIKKREERKMARRNYRKNKIPSTALLSS